MEIDAIPRLDEAVLDLIVSNDLISIKKLLSDPSVEIKPVVRLNLEFICMEGRGQYNEATQLMLGAIEEKLFFVPNIGALPWILDGFSCIGKFRQGLTMIRMAQQKGYSGWQLEVQEARFLALNREFEKALLVVRDAWTNIPVAERAGCGVFEARLLILLGEPKQALVKFKQYLHRPKGKRSLYDRVAKLAVKLGEYQVATRYASLSMQIFGGTVKSYIYLSTIFKKLENHNGVILNANHAINMVNIRNFPDPSVLRQCHKLITEARLSLMQFNPALNELLKYLEEDSAWVQGRALIVECYLALKLRENAEQVLAELLEEAPMDPNVLVAQHKLHIQYGNDETASAAFQVLVIHHADHVYSKEILARGNFGVAQKAVDEIASIEMPNAFIPQWTDRDLLAGGMTWEGLRGHARSVMALLLRETRTRFVRHKLGFLWAFLEPAVHTGLFVLIFLAIGRDSLYGMSLPLFIVTGIVPYQLFIGSYQQMLSVVSGNKDLFMHPRVQVLDVVVARSTLETMVVLVVFSVFFLGLAFFGGQLYIGDLLVVLLGFLGLLCCGVGLGLLTASIKIILPGVATIIQHATRLLFFTSGVFFAPEMFSPNIRDIMLLNPLLHYISMIRSNFTPVLGYDNIHFIYAFVWGLGLLTFGFMFERLFRYRMLSQ